jgi:hypothetical protein
MLVETTLSLVTLVFGLKKVFHRTTRYFAARLAYVAALFNSLLALNRSLAGRMVELGYVESISHVTVGTLLKKTNSNLGE